MTEDEVTLERRDRALSLFAKGRGIARLLFATLLAGAALPPLHAAGPTLAVPEGDILWGFDGTVMRDRFNPLTLVVDNPSPEAFDGEIRLHRADFAGRRTGGYLVESIYLAPATRRIVRFYPLAMSEMENWVLAWDGGQVTLPQPRHGPAARVLLTEEGDLFDRGGAVKRYPSRYFPPYATATDGLGELLIDRTPDWDPPQRQAFLDWLRGGGVVHLVHGPDGRFPQFSGDLAPLNEPSEEFRIGAGRVRRHDIDRGGLTKEFVKRRMDPEPPLPDAAAEEIERANQYGYDTSLEDWRMSSGVFNHLKQMVKAEHNWGVIHLLSLSYIAVLFPGCFLIGREFRNVPITFGAIGGATLLFGAAFYLVGNRGYGESTSVHAVALAEHVEANKFDVTQWSSVFLTSGGDYVFSNAGEERLYSDATDNEPVGSNATAGSAATFVADVPPFSTRVMADKALVRLRVAPPSVEPGSQGLPQFRLPRDFPAQVKSAYAVIDNRVASYVRVGDRLQPAGTPQPARTFLKPQNADFLTDGGGWGNDVEAPDRIGQLVRPAMVYSLRLTTNDELKAFYLPAGRIRLFVSSPLPDELRVLSAPAGSEGPGQPLTGQTGSVVYSFDLTL